MSPGGSLDIALAIQHAVRRDGQGRVMVELARALVDRGHRVTVYAHGLDECLRGKVDFVAIPRAHGPQIVDDLAMLWRTTRALRRRHHDVACVLGHTALPSCPTVFNAQFSHQGWRGSWGRGGRPTWRYRAHARVAAALERLCVRRSDRLVASTEQLAAEVTPGIAVPVTVVPNGVDLEEFSPPSPSERAEARAELGLGTEEFVIGFLGDYATPRKGLDSLVRAVARGPADERLVVAARGDDEGLAGLVRQLGIEDRVVVAGFAPPRTILSAADVQAVPSLYEPFSLVAFEAAACRVPVLLSACAGAAELLGEAALTVDDPSDPVRLRRGLDSVRSDRPSREQRVEAAQRVASELAWPAVAAAAADAVEAVARESATAGDAADGGARTEEARDVA